ncbi:MAG: Asp23/Gls24 family envelope stress response protein [Mycoplasmatales bacterium]
MKFTIKTNNEVIEVNPIELKTVIASQVEMVPGIYSLSSKSIMSKITDKLKHVIFPGIKINYLSANRVGISICVIVVEGVNLIHVTTSIQEIVKYTLKEKYGLKVKYVDVYIKGTK